MKDRVKQERNFWNSFAGKYDKFIKTNASDSYDNLLKKLTKECDNIDSMLEIATGTGILSLELSNYVKSITATDLAPDMLKIAKEKAEKKKISNINFEVADSNYLQFDDESFDLIIASNVLHLLFYPEKAISEMKRVLKPTGKLILPTYCHGQNLKTHLLSRFMGMFGFHARQRWSAKTFENFIENNGLQIAEAEVIKGKMPLLYLVAMR